jgi:hypothetical protein
MKAKEKEKLEIEQIPENMKDMIPSMNVGEIKKKEEEESLITDESLLTIYGEIADNIRGDRGEIEKLLNNFVDMVLNDGDSSTSSKEAVVNLIKLKSEQSDKMTKIADLMTRIKLKERDTFPRYLAASQNNTINIGDGRRALLEAITKAKKSTKKDDNEK